MKDYFKITALGFLLEVFFIGFATQSKANEQCYLVDPSMANKIFELRALIQELDESAPFGDDDVDEILDPEKWYSTEKKEDRPSPLAPDDLKEKVEKEVKKDLARFEALVSEIQLINDSQIVVCVKSADVVQKSGSWDIGGKVGLRLGKYVDLVDFHSSYNETTQVTTVIYTCRNNETGELFRGTMDDVVAWYNAYIQSKKN